MKLAFLLVAAVAAAEDYTPPAADEIKKEVPHPFAEQVEEAAPNPEAVAAAALTSQYPKAFFKTCE